MTDSTDPRPIDGPADEPTTEDEVFRRLVHAMVHIDTALTDIKAALEHALQKLGHLHAMGKRTESMLTHICLSQQSAEEEADHDRQAGF
jgi:hypothetical protein